MIKKFLYIILILIFLFIPIASPFVGANFYMTSPPAVEPMVISENTIWKKEDNLTFDKMVVITDGATLTIEKGAKIIFKQENERSFAMLGLTVVDGSLVANGETNEKITFSTESDTPFVIAINSKEYKSFLRYVKIIGGGFGANYQAYKKSFFNIAYAQSFPSMPSLPTLQIKGGKIDIENTEFINSKFGDVSVETNIIFSEKGEFQDMYFPEISIVNSNFSHQQAVVSTSCQYAEFAEGSGIECEDNNVYLKNNWYGNADGPNSAEGFQILGDYALDGYKKNKMIVDPVILIPGIMGSAYDTSGELRIDPIWHKYDDLVKSFAENGFVENKNFFVFPYDWRKSNKQTAILLKNKIEQIKEQAKISKVDIVAHSMGGLVAREYAEKENYSDNIDQLIFLGTPQKGAPKAYLMWEAGEGYIRALKWYLNHEAEEKGYDDLGKYVREKVLSVQDLLPIYDYLFDAEKNELRSYYDGYPRNEFLENLDLEENLNKLEKLEISNFVGNTEEYKTINEIKVVNKYFENKWEYGMPLGYDKNSFENNLVLNSGDGTVPLVSAKAINSNIKKEFKSGHTILPTKTQCEIIEELTAYFVDENLDEEDQPCKYVDKWDGMNVYLFFRVFSPIDIQIIAPDGKRVGKNFETGGFYDEIEGAYYTGYDTDTEFITIPSPIAGDYQILTQGTDDGDYKIEITNITENENGETTEQELIIQANTTLGDEKNHSISLDENELRSDEIATATNENQNENQNEDETITTEENTNSVDSNSESNDENNENDSDNDSNNDSENDNADKKKDNKKKKSNKKSEIASSVQTNDSNLKIAVAEADQNDKPQAEKIMGDSTEKEKNVNENIDEQADEQGNKQNKSIFALAGVAFIGILLLLKNILNWLKFKKKKEEEF